LKPFQRPTGREAIHIAGHILDGSGSAGGAALVEALAIIHEEKEWLKRPSSVAGSYASFAELACDRRPHGLGVNDQASYRLVRFGLRELKLYCSLAELNALLARTPGRPPTNNANDDGSWFLTIPTAKNSLDRILITLKRAHPAEYAEVCAGTLTPRQAAIRAGIVSAGARTNGVCDLAAAAHLSERGKFKVAKSFWNVMSLNEQCTFISRLIEPGLGEGLARRWREINTPPDQGG
jgi:hypothetical protein